MIVVDTNVISYLHLEGQKTADAEAVLQVDSGWTAPFLWRDEFRNVLIQYVKKDILTVNDGFFLLRKAEHLLHGREYFVPGRDVLLCAHNTGLSGYDSTFVALARNLDLRLVTEDTGVLECAPDVALSMRQFLQDESSAEGGQ